MCSVEKSSLTPGRKESPRLPPLTWKSHFPPHLELMACVLFREELGLASLPTEAQLSHHHPLIGPPSTDLRGARTACHPRLHGSLSPWTSLSLVHLPLLGPKLDSSVTMAVSSVPLSRRAHLIVASPKFLEMNCPGPWAPTELNEIQRKEDLIGRLVSLPPHPQWRGPSQRLSEAGRVSTWLQACGSYLCIQHKAVAPPPNNPSLHGPSTGCLPRGLFQGTRSLASGQSCFERSRRPTTGLTRTLPTPPRLGAQPGHFRPWGSWPHRPRPWPRPTHMHICTHGLLSGLP